MKTLAAFVLTIAVLCCALPSLCQTETATISGRVTDPQGAVISGAEVQVQNVLTGWETVTRTNSSGLYVVTAIQPGTYRVIVSNPGFKQIVKPGVVLNVQDDASLNFSMTIGSASETVTVAGGAPLVNTQDASVSTVIDRNFVENLPLNGRSFNTLLQLTPGVVIAQQPNGFSHGQFSVAGQRADANNFTVDGVSANFGVSSTALAGESGTGSAQAFSALGGTSGLVSVDALQEFRIETSSFAPEFGRAPGGQVILTTRSGTNEFHGGIFDYFRNTALDANNWFNNATIPPTPKAPEHHNDFGGFVSGPIWKDNTFFFVSYEGARLDLPTTQQIQVPYTGVPACSPPAAIAPILSAYPQPNGSVSAATCTGEFTGAFANKATLNAGSVRIDHKFNDRLSIFGRYNNAPSEMVSRADSLSELETTDTNTQTLTVGLNMALSGQVFNALRGNYSTQRSTFSYALDSYGGAVPPSLGILIGSLPPAQTAALFAPLDGTAFLNVGPNANNCTRQVNIVDDLSVTARNHQLKFGTDYRAIFLDTVPFTHLMEYLSFGVQDFVTTGQVFLFAPVTDRSARVLTHSLSLYAQDTWRASSRLTLTYGLRWDLSPAPSARGGTTLASWLNVDNPAAMTLAPDGTALWQTRYGNVAPRVGIAYSLNDAGTMVLRAGAGVFYDIGIGSAANLAGLFPNSADGSFYSQPVPVSNIDSFLPVISSAPPYPAFSTAGFRPDLKLPRSYQWSVALQRSFGDRQAISATYVGQAGRDLLRQEALFQPNPNFAGVFNLTQNDAMSNYHALQLQYRRPVSSRVQAVVNYTYSHSLDNASNDVVAGLSNTVISAATDYASSDFDVRHSFSGAVTVALPAAGRSGALALLTKDWSLDAVVAARTGFPFNTKLSAPFSLGLGFIRPDRVPGEPIYVYGAECAQVFGPIAQGGNGVLMAGQTCPGGQGLNPNAFSIPGTPRQGTEGRNDLRGFGLTQIDLSIGRKFPITERLNLQFRADAFNLFNHPNFTNPSGLVSGGPSFLLSQSTLNVGLGGLNPLFQQGGPRSLQLSLRLAF
jgi:Carboxypeptidase regulatory-like domain/TonB dependent receptor-like, beta-barrel